MMGGDQATLCHFELLVEEPSMEEFQRILQRHGYFKAGLRKIEAARAISAHVDPSRNRSRSFLAFYNAIIEGTS